MILLDPLLAIPPGHPCATSASDLEFWSRIHEWAADKRVFIGESAHKLIYEEYAQYGYPEHSLDLSGFPAGREYRAALDKLLSRVWRHKESSKALSFCPQYLGTLAQQEALQRDVSGVSGREIFAIATDVSHWQGGNVSIISITPPPPSELEACLVPGIELVVERSSKIKTAFADKRLHVVGGQVDQTIISDLYDKCGILAGDISWLPCEKAKPPRDLGKRWKHLDARRDVAVCITGRVGHATSNAASVAAKRAGVPYLEIEYPSQLVRRLSEFASRGG